MNTWQKPSRQSGDSCDFRLDLDAARRRRRADSAFVAYRTAGSIDERRHGRGVGRPFGSSGGVFADLRATMVVLSVFFGGPIVGIAVFISASAYRMWVGGLGAPGEVVGMAVALAIGVAGRFPSRAAPPTYDEGVVLAAAAAIGSLAGSLFLPPPGIQATLFPDVAVAVATLTFVVTAVAGAWMVSDLRRRGLDGRTSSTPRSSTPCPSRCMRRIWPTDSSPPIRPPPR